MVRRTDVPYVLLNLWPYKIMRIHNKSCQDNKKRFMLPYIQYYNMIISLAYKVNHGSTINGHCTNEK